MTEPNLGDNSGINVDASQLNEFLLDLEDKQKTISEATGQLRNAIKTIVVETGWHKGAFGTVRTINKMSETARADFLRTFEPLFEAMMDNSWRGEMRDLIEQIEAEGAD